MKTFLLKPTTVTIYGIVAKINCGLSKQDLPIYYKSCIYLLL